MQQPLEQGFEGPAWVQRKDTAINPLDLFQEWNSIQGSLPENPDGKMEPDELHFDPPFPPEPSRDSSSAQNGNINSMTSSRREINGSGQNYGRSSRNGEHAEQSAGPADPPDQSATDNINSQSGRGSEQIQEQADRQADAPPSQRENQEEGQRRPEPTTEIRDLIERFDTADSTEEFIGSLTGEEARALLQYLRATESDDSPIQELRPLLEAMTPPDEQPQGMEG